MTKLKFLEKRGNRLDFVGTKVVPFLNNNQLQKTKGGAINPGEGDTGAVCNPWSDCDAWHCGPDCICKSNLA
ncbi:MAG: hypothetical protein MI739_08165 [Bacteroidales bacterium]|nr:hypothetical protein [Bacteroidales bacterium]